MDAQVEAWRFGRFTLRPARRLLLADGQPVALSSRAYDILELLVRCHDRIVTRDEIIAHVWRGTVVGENNLTVQMSNLRRALGEHAGGEPLIVNLPGRGYRLVAEVTEVLPFCVAAPEPASLAPETPPQKRTRRWRWLVGSAGVSLALLLPMMAGAPALQRLVSGSVRDMRLSVAVHRFTPIGDDPRAATLAIRYTEALLARFAQFEDFVLYAGPPTAENPVMPRFELTGTVEIVNADAVLTVGVRQTRDGQLLYRHSLSTPDTAAIAEQSTTALHMLVEIRPILFRVEAERRGGPPRDAIDFVIDAHRALGQSDQIANLRRALALAREAVRRDPADRPARVLLALLLTDDMMFSSAQAGDQEGWQALALIDDVLREQPRNSLYISRRAYVLEALGKLDDAQATAELGLRIDPGFPLLTDRLGEVLMLEGNVAVAKTLYSSDSNDTQDNTLATIAFAEGRYADALVLVGQVVAATPDTSYARFNLLLEVATLSRLGRMREAKDELTRAMAGLPPALRSVGAQRQAVYVLPYEAWRKFKQGLAAAGMPP
ncbi:winged helix-turn-helix domain-containing protein [Lichenicoccus sp.]|uniref:transcriptional regulator n=1 Tax=Lichenicoccus sp. TaxID=2781899 RepID=UPI003D1375A4